MPRPLVFHPSERTAPKEVILHLREIDPTFELVWVDRAWLLGRVRPTAYRYTEGGRLLKAELQMVEVDPGTVQYARLAMQGFAATESYEHREADSRIIEDARLRWYNLQNCAGETFAARLDETLGGPRHRANLARVRDGARAVGREAYRRADRRPAYSRPYSRAALSRF